MVVRVLERARMAAIGPVYVACDGEEIAQVVRQHGAEAIVTDPALPSGSDRIWQALARIPGQHEFDVVVNLQGDVPTVSPAALRAVLTPLADAEVDIATLAAAITHEEERHDPSIVKPVVAWDAGATRGRALYFTRATAPYGDGALYHHIGIYAYRRAALERFVSLPPSALEQREKLEQLRALEAGMRMDVVCVDDVPLGVDTPEQLEKARRWYREQI